MEKLKLQKTRIAKGLSQQDMAILANMDQTTYGRKENGVSKITSMEWRRFASILDVPLKEIFEDDENTINISNDNSPNSKVIANSSNSANHTSDHCNVPDYILESLKKYIEKLESENKSKEEEIIALKAKLQQNS